MVLLPAASCSILSLQLNYNSSRERAISFILAAVIAILTQSVGLWAIALPLLVLIPKIAVEISRGVCYDNGRKEGITNAVSQKDGAVLPLLPL